MKNYFILFVVQKSALRKSCKVECIFSRDFFECFVHKCNFENIFFRVLDFDAFNFEFFPLQEIHGYFQCSLRSMRKKRINRLVVIIQWNEECKTIHTKKVKNAMTCKQFIFFSDNIFCRWFFIMSICPFDFIAQFVCILFLILGLIAISLISSLTIHPAAL